MKHTDCGDVLGHKFLFKFISVLFHKRILFSMFSVLSFILRCWNSIETDATLFKPYLAWGWIRILYYEGSNPPSKLRYPIPHIYYFLLHYWYNIPYKFGDMVFLKSFPEHYATWEIFTVFLYCVGVIFLYFLNCRLKLARLLKPHS